MVEQYKAKHHVDKHNYNIKTQKRISISTNEDDEERGLSIDTSKTVKTLNGGRMVVKNGYPILEKRINANSRVATTSSKSLKKSSRSMSSVSTQSELFNKRKHITIKGATSKDIYFKNSRTNVASNNSRIRKASSNISSAKSRVGSFFGKNKVATETVGSAGKQAISGATKVHPAVLAASVTVGLVGKASDLFMNSGKQNEKSDDNVKFGGSGLKAMLFILILILGIPCSFFGIFLNQYKPEDNADKYIISNEVMEYEATVDSLIKLNKIEDYKFLVLSIMQYSKLNGCFETGDLMAVTLTTDTTFYNTYKDAPLESYKKGSLQVGTSRLAKSLTLTKCNDPKDFNKIQYALGVYLYGERYSDYLIKNNLLDMKYEDKHLETYLLDTYDYIEAHNQIPVAKGFINTAINYYKHQNKELVEIAAAEAEQVNEGGEKYWRWYGFDSYVQWCACFVSWCCDQAGYIESKQVIKFANCDEGIRWFKENKQWKTDLPKAGDIIFFDWNGDRISDHVGIVTAVDKSKVYTIEGNTYRSVVPLGCVKQQEYLLTSNQIMGYAFVGAKKK